MKIRKQSEKIYKNLKLLCVIVLTPSLNKSFKFESEWPYSNSQVYLLQSLLQDLNNDKALVLEKKDNGYSSN